MTSRHGLRRSSCVFLTAFLLAQLVEADIEVAVVQAGGGGTDVELCGLPLAPGSVADSGLPTSECAARKVVTTPWQGSLALDEDKPWELSARADGWWIAPHHYQPTAQSPGEATTLRLLPGHVLSGSFEVEGEHTLPSQFRLTLDTDEPSGGSERIRSVATSCTIQKEGEWHCPVPLGNLDLTIEVEGFVPHYVWGLESQPESTLELESMNLVRGASLVGWVELAEQVDDGEPTRVELVPRTTGWQGDPVERRRAARRTLHGEVSERGFFQISLVAAGVYDLTASRAGFVPTTAEAVEVVEGVETALKDVVVLRRPRSLNVYISPPVDPLGQPWTVALRRPLTAANVDELVDQSAAGFDGHWQFGSLGAGTYHLEVRDLRDSSWLSRRIELGTNEEPLFLELETVSVRGRLTLGEEPIAGQIYFGTRYGRPNIRMMAFGDGLFEGLVPRAGAWDVEVIQGDGTAVLLEELELSAVAGGGVVELELVLPDTRVSGKVFYRDQPAVGALVMIKRELEGRWVTVANVETDEEGRLEVRGLVPGAANVAAYLGAFDPASEWARFEVSEAGDTPSLSLELIDKRSVRGQMTSQGQPVAGAQVALRPVVDQRLAWPAEAMTNAEGRFTLRLPRGRQGLYDLLVVAAGYGVTSRRIAVDVEKRLGIELSADRGDLLLSYPAGFLHHSGSVVAAELIVPALLKNGRAAWVPGGEGLSLLGVEPGHYSLCPGRALEPRCVSGVVTPGGRLELLPSWLAEDWKEAAHANLGQ